jgi:hypothetical protein
MVAFVTNRIGASIAAATGTMARASAKSLPVTMKAVRDTPVAYAALLMAAAVA